MVHKTILAALLAVVAYVSIIMLIGRSVDEKVDESRRTHEIWCRVHQNNIPYRDWELLRRHGVLPIIVFLKKD